MVEIVVVKKCQECGGEFPVDYKFRRNQCSPCYRREFNSRAQNSGHRCCTCNSEAVLNEFDECKLCVQKRWYANRKKGLNLKKLEEEGRWINCPKCGKQRKHNDLSAKMCTHCLYLARTEGQVPRRRDGSSTYLVNGYVRIRSKDHPNRTKDGWIFEHTVVMSSMIGRPLAKGESVHHKNGVRDDNRPENLELWTVHQPRGQRVSDLEQNG